MTHPTFGVLALLAIVRQTIALLAYIALTMTRELTLSTIGHRAVKADSTPLYCLTLQASLLLYEEKANGRAYNHSQDPN